MEAVNHRPTLLSTFSFSSSFSLKFRPPIVHKILPVCPLSPSRTLGHEVVLFLMEPPRGVATLEQGVNFFSCFDAVRGFVKWWKSAWRLSSLWLPKWGFLHPSIHPWASPKKRRVSVGLQMGSKPFLSGQLDSSACWWIPEKSRKSRRENCVQRRQILHDDSKDSRGLDLLRWMSSPGICE